MSDAGTSDFTSFSWKTITEAGQSYGNYPNATKSILILKPGTENLPKANSMYGKLGVTITTDKECHLGSAIGTKDFQQCDDVREFAEIAKEESQVA